MSIDTTKLRELAQKATPGPWEQINHIVFTETGDLEWVVANARSGNSIIDAEYIAAANPAAALALLDEIDRLRSDLDCAAQCIANQIQTIARLLEIEKAARNLQKAKGRHNTEIAMNRLLETLK